MTSKEVAGVDPGEGNGGQLPSPFQSHINHEIAI